MRVAVIGQGSIGRRHAEILLELGHDVVVYDPDSVREGPPGAMRAEDLDAAMNDAEAAVIASPSSEHATQARRAIEESVPVLVEKPLATDVARAAELEWLARERGATLAVAMNLRHHAAVLGLRTLLGEDELGRVLRASAWCGSWLPGWRPGSDYRTSYSARSELGGGVLLDVAIHELDYLLSLLGPAAAVTAVAGRVSSLELDVEDVALIALELVSGAVAEIVVDYFDRSYHRGCRIVGEQGSVEWSWEDERLTLLRPDAPPDAREVPSDVAPGYRRQLECFLAVARGGVDGTVGGSEARRVLAVIEAARASARDGRRVALAPPVALRASEERDRDHVLEWRNDPETRRWSVNEDEVSADEHERWFERALADPATTIWVGEVESTSIGQVRVTREEPGSAELHVTLAPEARGRGLGSELLIEAAARSLAEPGIERLVARVKKGNERSRRAFERAGFDWARDDIGLELLERRACGH